MIGEVVPMGHRSITTLRKLPIVRPASTMNQVAQRVAMVYLLLVPDVPRQDHVIELAW